MGGIVVITSPTSLSDDARQALVDFGPDLVIIAGGTAAISQETEQAIDDAGDWTVDRAFGTGRDATAAEVSKVLAERGIGRPLVTGSGEVVGDVNLGGKLHADSLGVDSNTKVTNLNADLLDGTDSSDFAKADHSHAAQGLPETVVDAIGPGADSTVVLTEADGTKTILSAAVSAPSMTCSSGSPQHEYLARITGQNSGAVGNATADAVVTVDSTTMTDNPTLRRVVNFEHHESYASEWVFAVGTGNHTFRLLADVTGAESGAEMHFDHASLAVQHVGSSCV